MSDAGVDLPWYRQIGPTQWRAFWATFLGWMLDGFDFTILTFVLIDIQQSFAVDKALAGALGTVTLLFRLIGGVAAGTAADRWGRKLPLMLSILWFSLFAFLSGFSTSYAMLFALRALFGIGMGGEWAAGMPLALEHWPARFRGIASGLLQAGFLWGFALSAFVFRFLYPFFRSNPDLGWRAMFWVGVLPALLVLWIRSGVAESPVWLARRARLRDTPGSEPGGISFLRLWRPDLIGVTIQCSLLIGASNFAYYALTFWYPTLLREANLDPFAYLVTFNVGGILGGALWGVLSETRLGRRGCATAAGCTAIALIPLYLARSHPNALWLGAFVMPLGVSGIWSIIPAYLSERFPTEVRGVGPGFAYHAGTSLGSIAPTLIGALTDRGMALTSAMGVSIAAAGVCIAALIWLGPETRGRSFVAFEAEPLPEPARLRAVRTSR